ncbi:MAG: winged helix-turn-helix transcriptional regulator [Candidatus Doudnabacteria bacterium]|nr:winged helix-turn-helix transcriptional regulator [Candidatus Doudnabacteria bacterium]
MNYKSPTLRKIQLSQNLEEKARLLELAGDPTRVRILCALYQYEDVCVSDIAESLNMTVSAISHHLQLLKDNGLVETRRMGQNICYSLVNSDFTKKLKKIVCG